MHQIAQRFQPFGTTIFATMTRLANEHQAVNLSQGFPDFDGPDFVKQAAINAMNAGKNQYARLAGEIPLVEQLAQRFTDRTGLEADPITDITITSGCTEAIAATFLGLINPGDEVILFEPFYDSYQAAVAMAGATPRFVRLAPVGGRFTFDPAELARAFGPKTRAILVNTPHNPTGTVFTAKELGTIADLCKTHDCLAISDEVYEELVFDRPHLSIASLDGMASRTVTLSSLGKTFSLTGWKIGWAIAPPDLSAGVRSAHQFLTYAVPTPLQYGAATALRDGQPYIRELVSRYRSARDFLAEGLSGVGFDVILPEGTYFIMAEHSKISERLGTSNDIELSQRLITDFGVASIPPSVFCDTAGLCENYLRFAFCKEQQTLNEAVRRLRKVLG